MKASSDSDSSSDSNTDTAQETDSEVGSEDELDANADIQQQILQMQQLQLQQAGLQPVGSWAVPGGGRGPRGGRTQASRNPRHPAGLGLDSLINQTRSKKERKVKRKPGSKLEFKRVDQLWDNTIHNYKLTDTAEDEESSEYDQYLFNVRRTFDWEGKYKVCFAVPHMHTQLTSLDHHR